MDFQARKFMYVFCHSHIISICIVLFGIFVCFVQCQTQSDKIKLTDLKELELYRDKFTNSRRLVGVAQLKCVNGFYKCHQYAPSYVKCYNKGQEGQEVQWECKAKLDSHVKFGYIRVSCEGYDHPNDEYILADSCGLEYSLELISRSGKAFNDNFQRDLYEKSKLSNFLTMLIMIVVILAIYKSCTKYRDNESLRQVNFNSLYGIQDGFDTPNQNMANMPANSFPPPPPPYGFVSRSMPANSNLAQSASFNGTAEAESRRFKMTSPNQNAVNQDSQNNHVDNLSTSTTLPSVTTMPGANNGSAWSNFLTGTNGVTSLLSRRMNNSPTTFIESTTRRSDSPPPAYDDHVANDQLSPASRR